ncbi:hypothetical protein tb265_42820 [Gemmatimonadetes bacterium T265]|nr:hypothetical protein tb265_42820 [Gemmatimonadetes bacterium T265]
MRVVVETQWLVVSPTTTSVSTPARQSVTPALKLRQCRALIAVADHGGPTRAAAALGVAQSTVSEALLALERVVGGPLLAHGGARGARTRLTPAGAALLPHARALLGAADAALAAARAAAGDAPLRAALGASESVSTYVLPPLLAALRHVRESSRLASHRGGRLGLPGLQRRAEELDVPPPPERVQRLPVGRAAAQRLGQPAEEGGGVEPGQELDEEPPRPLADVDEGVGGPRRDAHHVPRLGGEPPALNLEAVAAIQYVEDLGLPVRVEWRAAAGGVRGLEARQRAPGRLGRDAHEEFEPELWDRDGRLVAPCRMQDSRCRHRRAAIRQEAGSDGIAGKTGRHGRLRAPGELSGGRPRTGQPGTGRRIHPVPYGNRRPAPISLTPAPRA